MQHTLCCVNDRVLCTGLDSSRFSQTLSQDSTEMASHGASILLDSVTMPSTVFSSPESHAPFQSLVAVATATAAGMLLDSVTSFVTE